jgi:hypothetical protein
MAPTFETSHLPEKYDNLPDKERHWPAPPGSEEEGLGMLRLLTPDVVAVAAYRFRQASAYV